MRQVKSRVHYKLPLMISALTSLMSTQHCIGMVDNALLATTVPDGSSNRSGTRHWSSNKNSRVQEGHANHQSHRQQSSRGAHAQPNASGQSSSHQSSRRRPTEIVRGGRKIWGTRRGTDVRAVESALARVIEPGTFFVKRKFKPQLGRQSGKWWYVVRATEEILNQLVGNWSVITADCGWTIEYLHRFSDVALEQPTTASISNEYVRLDDVANDVSVGQVAFEQPTTASISNGSVHPDDVAHVRNDVSIGQVSPLPSPLDQSNALQAED